jgi:hypothetical protein
MAPIFAINRAGWQPVSNSMEPLTVKAVNMNEACDIRATVFPRT